MSFPLTAGMILGEGYRQVRTDVTSPNSPPTDFAYTGQRLLDEGMGGLMDYKSRFYDPYLNQFTQPDTIVPNPANPQDWNRYSYVRNNPPKYIDPSGHSVDCGLGDPYCQAGKFTPGGLIQLYRLYYGKDVDRRDSEVRSKLSSEINDYMKNNPEYHPQRDNYLNYLNRTKNYKVFGQIREEYWNERIRDAGASDTAFELFNYYDMHWTNTQYRAQWNSGNIDWDAVWLDSTSFVASFVGLNAATRWKTATQTFSFVAGGTSLGYSISGGDGDSILLSSGGMIPGPAGTIFSGASVLNDLTAAYELVPYIPSIPRIP